MQKHVYPNCEIEQGLCQFRNQYIVTTLLRSRIIELIKNTRSVISRLWGYLYLTINLNQEWIKFRIQEKASCHKSAHYHLPVFLSRPMSETPKTLNFDKWPVFSHYIDILVVLILNQFGQFSIVCKVGNLSCVREDTRLPVKSDESGNYNAFLNFFSVPFGILCSDLGACPPMDLDALAEIDSFCFSVREIETSSTRLFSIIVFSIFRFLPLQTWQFLG